MTIFDLKLNFYQKRTGVQDLDTNRNYCLTNLLTNLSLPEPI